MHHHITLNEQDYNATELYLATKHNPLYASGDTLSVTLDGQREQKSFTIVKVLAEPEKINKHYCILLLDSPGGQPVVDLTGVDFKNLSQHGAEG